jgi:hypothetical protein
MLATVVLELDHVTEVVMSLLLPSLYLPVAMNCWVNPAGTDAVAGVTVIL